MYLVERAGDATDAGPEPATQARPRVSGTGFLRVPAEVFLIIDELLACWLVDFSVSLLVAMVLIQALRRSQVLVCVEDHLVESTLFGAVFEHSEQPFTESLSLVLRMNPHSLDFGRLAASGLKSSDGNNLAIYEPNKKLAPFGKILLGNVGEVFICGCILNKL